MFAFREVLGSPRNPGQFFLTFVLLDQNSARLAGLSRKKERRRKREREREREGGE
jgi:hypothetical protein